MSHRQRLLRVPESLVDALNERIKEGVVDGVTYAYDDGGVLRFSLGGKTYPARLVNLPCVVESHKTLDKASYFKSGDVGQMIIVYESEEAYKASSNMSLPKIGLEECWPDGITPPTRNIVRRKFQSARPAQGKSFPKQEVMNVEDQILSIIQAATNKEDIIETVHEEVVDFEPWMLDMDAARTGRVAGLEIEVKGPTADGSGRHSKLFGHEILLQHPEILLSKHDFPSSVKKPVVSIAEDKGGREKDDIVLIHEAQEEELAMGLFDNLEDDPDLLAI